MLYFAKEESTQFTANSELRQQSTDHFAEVQKVNVECLVVSEISLPQTLGQ